MHTKSFFVGWALLLTLFTGCDKPAGGDDAAKKESTAATAPLIGRWVRPDGGYILMVNRVEPEGKLGASYFNPNPIRVSAAQASVEGGAVKLFVELRDEGYPGCTYNLTYDKANDQLVGVYFQAAQQQSYDIAFERAQ
jgi:hypothetical protein